MKANPKKPLHFGDLVVGPDGMPAILLAPVDPDDHGEVPVAMARGTEEMVSPVGLLPVPSAHGAPHAANFAEWIVPMALPHNRAVYAFMGRGLTVDDADYDRAAIALVNLLVPIVAALPPESFEEVTKREYLRTLTRVLNSP